MGSSSRVAFVHPIGMTCRTGYLPIREALPSSRLFLPLNLVVARGTIRCGTRPGTGHGLLVTLGMFWAKRLHSIAVAGSWCSYTSARLLAVTDRQLHESGNRDEVARNLGSLRASGIQIQGYAYRVLGILQIGGRPTIYPR